MPSEDGFPEDAPSSEDGPKMTDSLKTCPARPCAYSGFYVSTWEIASRAQTQQRISCPALLNASEVAVVFVRFVGLHQVPYNPEKEQLFFWGVCFASRSAVPSSGLASLPACEQVGMKNHLGALV